MTKEEWAVSENAHYMLKILHHEQPGFLASQVPQIHRFLIACCWKHKHLIPQRNLRKGLQGAEKWLAGEISDDELYKLNWFAEGEAFVIDYAKTDEDIRELMTLFASIPELDGLPYPDAWQLMRKAAYFAEMSMIYSMFRRLPWIESLFSSQFLCPDLLREYIKPDF